MKFDIIRDLKDKVFKVDIVRKQIADDPEMEKEAQLEDDFGLVEIETGGLFVGYVSNDTLDIVLEKPSDEKTYKELKFALSKNTIKLIKETIIKFQVDAKAEANIDEKLTSLKVAELKNELFIKVIQKRINEAVDKWKKQTTDFEKKTPTEFDIPLS